MKKISLLITGILLVTSCNQQQGVLQSDMASETAEQNFINPPSSAKPHTWWHWMNGNITKEGITADLEAMAEAGLGGAQIFNAAEGIPHDPVQFNSPEWMELVKHAATEAKRLGLDLCLHNCAGWSSSGGPWNTPEHSMKIVVTSETQVTGPAKITDAPPQPETNLDFYRDIAILAFRKPATDSKKTAIDNLDIKIFLDRGNIPSGQYAELPAGVAVKQDEIIDLTDKLLDPNGKNSPRDASLSQHGVIGRKTTYHCVRDCLGLYG